MGNLLKAFSNPFYRTSSLEILLFFAGWGIWWSFFQIWLTTKQGFTGAQVGTIYSFGSAVALVLMFVYGSLQDKLGMKKTMLKFFAVCQILVGPFFTWVYVPMLASNFYVGAVVGAVYLAVAFLAACPVFEAVTERLSRRYSFEYGQARAWGSFGYAVAALCAGFLFTMNPNLIFWMGSAVAAVQLIVLVSMTPENDASLTAKYEVKSESLKESKTPSFGEIIGVLNSIEVFLEFLMMGLVPILMRRIGVRKAILLGCAIMIVRIGGCGLVTNPLGVAIIKLLHAPETALFILAVFRYFTLHFDTRISATLYMVGFQIAAQVGQIIFSTPLGALHDSIGYQSTFLVISGIVCVASLYAFVILKKDDQQVDGQPL